ncbi:urea ABC transporter ATP-binding protein UrtD [Deinococcus cellulosilyticus]|uniref:ABC transporter ATP-binding protein n=1 Tax=Deinococcus cellulosilyticus (strain DSM 18568 / NBRC 106333 / KACC 11606 / 5516J-15) TaxID=1223518 RepID=A0A511MXY9_DEIC1|nr:urea ABC transporter ATP-binding protein UrtD [Deinococcus cellulosilyticus]GEM45007.1 ABC transporter ATP-binding protein [Deinococcus cellulosilyticus NBRC 106333 = KACC 11606]
MTEALLEIKGVTVSFDGFVALNNVNFSVKPGEVRILMGPNGAGKSTLMDTVIGKVRADQGQIFFQGKDISRTPEYRITGLGICRKFQTPGVLENLTVKENLELSARKSKGFWGSLKTRLSKEETDRVSEVLKKVRLQEKAVMQARHLAHGEKQWLEIGMVLAANPPLIMLDEPTAGMTVQETALTAALIQELAKEHTIIVIDHDMTFIELLQADVSVLHMGKMLCEGTLNTVRNNEEVQSVYLGRHKEEAHA